MKQTKTICTLLLALALVLAGCGAGSRRPAHKISWTDAPAYLSKDVPLPVQAGNLTGCCTDGEFMYYLADEETEGTAAPVLCRVSLEEGTTERMAKYEAPQVPEGAYANRIGPVLAPDGTLWVYEMYAKMYFDLPEDFDPERESSHKYFTGRDAFHHLYQLDPVTGEEKKLVDLSEAVQALELESAYGVTGFAVDGKGSICLAGPGSVAVADGKGRHLFTLEADMPPVLTTVLSGGPLALLPDGTVAILSALPGGQREARVIDPAAKGWGAKRFALPAGTERLCTGTGGFLFFYSQGSNLYAWEPEAESPRLLLNWGDTGLTGSTVCFAPLDGGKLAALTLQYARDLRLSVLSPSSVDPNAGKIKLVCGAIFADSSLRDRINRFNKTNSQSVVHLRDYAGDGLDPNSLSNDAYLAAYDTARLLLRADVASGSGPDIWDSSLLPDAYARKGYLEDLWPWIDGDQELGGREALMEHALECVSVDGKLYKVSPAFTIVTLAARSDLVGRRTGWTLEELLDCWRQMPEGSRITEPNYDRSILLSVLIQYDNGSWVDWSGGTCRFDTQEFKNLLELCRQAGEDGDPVYAAGSAESGLREGRYLFRQVFLNHPQDLLFYDALCAGPENLMDYEAYLEENNVYASLIDEDGNYREGHAVVCPALAFAEENREKGRSGSYPLAANAVFGALEGGGYVSFVGFPSQDRAGSRIMLGDCDVGMSAACRHKEGAWAFIRQSLLPGAADPTGAGRSAMNLERVSGFPINKHDFEEYMAPDWLTDSAGSVVLDKSGSPIEDPSVVLSVPETQGGEIYSVMEVYELFDDDVRRERFLELYNAAVPSQHIGPELLTIIREQVQPYFAGDKSVDETAALIQNRAQLYIGENR